MFSVYRNKSDGIILEISKIIIIRSTYETVRVHGPVEKPISLSMRFGRGPILVQLNLQHSQAQLYHIYSQLYSSVVECPLRVREV